MIEEKYESRTAFTKSKLAATEVAGRNVSHYVEAECDKGGREIEIMGLLYIMVHRVPN
jgi:hypothetical protein